jgi:hypothetical protein
MKLAKDPEFYVQQRVLIIELMVKGTIVGLFLDGSGWQYQVRYFFNGEAKTVYFFGWEIDSKEREKPLP